MSILTMLFLGLCALIVVFQLVPSVILFIGMVKGLFAPAETIEKTIKH